MQSKNETINNRNPIESLQDVCSNHGTTWNQELILENYNCTQNGAKGCPNRALCCQNKCFGQEQIETELKMPKLQCQGSL